MSRPRVQVGVRREYRVMHYALGVASLDGPPGLDLNDELATTTVPYVRFRVSGFPLIAGAPPEGLRACCLTRIAGDEEPRVGMVLVPIEESDASA